MILVNQSYSLGWYLSIRDYKLRGHLQSLINRYHPEKKVCFITLGLAGLR